MPTTLLDAPPSTHRVLPEVSRRPAKADLRKPEMGDCRAQIGAAVQRAADLLGWNLDQLADAVGRDPRQVRRWIDGTERAQLDTLFAVEALRQPLVIALAELAGVEIETTLRIRRRTA